jgi:LacI family transcriptional regulator
MLAVGCYGALEAAGLSCPGDISVVGFNDMPFIDRLRPPLTSVSFPHYQVGAEAGRLILEQIAARAEGSPGNGEQAKVLFLAPELKVRGSTARPGR